MYYFNVLKFTEVSEPIAPYQNEDSDWITPEQPEGVVKEFECRYEPNDSGRSSRSEDSNEFKFGGMVYMPLENPDILAGVSIEVFKDENIIATGTVKRFSRGTMNSRIWV